MRYDYSYVFSSMSEETRVETNHSNKTSKKLTVCSYDDVFIVPSSRFDSAGIIDKNGNSIPESCLNELCRVNAIDLTDDDIPYCDETVIYIGILHNVWGHCLTDALKKIWFLRTDYCMRLQASGIKIVYLLPDNQPLRQYAKELYQLAGVDIDSFEPICRVTKYREVIIPENSIICTLSNHNRWHYEFSEEYSKTIYSIKTSERLSNKESELYDKIYLTRSHINTHGREYGEKAIEQVFRAKGFKVVAPEEYSISEQVFMLSHCKELAVTEGSISHSSLFCNPGTKIILIRKSFYVNGYQTIINEVADLDVTYIDAHCSSGNKQWCNNPMYGPFYMCITPELERFIGHKIFHLPLWMRPSWWWYCNRNRKIVHKIQSLFASNLKHE